MSELIRPDGCTSAASFDFPHRSPESAGRRMPVRGAAAAWACLLGTLLSGTVLAGATATSQLALSGQVGGTYGPSNLTDANFSTVWIEGKDGPGLNESVTIDVPRATIVGVDVYPGHSENERLCKKYSRLKEVSLTFFSMSDTRELKPLKQLNHTFEDACKLQRVAVEALSVGGELFGGQVQLTIRSVYPGGDYQDTAIGELRAVLREFPAQLADPTGPAAAKGSSPANLVDGVPATVWISEGDGVGQVLTIEAPDFGLAALVITPGDLASPRKPGHYARPKDIVVELGGQTLKHTLKDVAEPQRLDFPPLHGYNGSLFGSVKITIESVYPGSVPQVVISEISLLATQLAL